MAYVNIANPTRRAPRYIDTSDFRAPFDSPTPTLTGLGATASDVTAKADAMKRCANPKLEQAGLAPVGMGPPAGGTCSLAYSMHSSGCPFRGEIQRYCKAKGITATGLRPAVTKTHQDIQDRFLQERTEAAHVALTKLRAGGSASIRASDYPWGAFSAKTVQLQKAINEAGRKLTESKGIPGTAPAQDAYCHITEDGKLGPGTCGAAKAVNVPYPKTCQSFATDCRGTLVYPRSRVPTQQDQPSVVVRPPERKDSAAPVVTEPTTTKKLPKSKPGFLGANALVFGIVALSVAAVGGATYVVGQKKGWWGKKPSSSKGAAWGGLF